MKISQDIRRDAAAQNDAGGGWWMRRPGWPRCRRSSGRGRRGGGEGEGRSQLRIAAAGGWCIARSKSVRRKICILVALL